MARNPVAMRAAGIAMARRARSETTVARYTNSTLVPMQPMRNARNLALRESADVEEEEESMVVVVMEYKQNLYCNW
jgi:hypothetical protein